jgi:branched-chain amino acid transport system substrate-binding protein
MTKRRSLSALGALALAAVLAACGGSSSGGGGGGATPTGGSSSSAAAGGTIKIGVMCTCSGAGGFGAFIKPGEQVYEAWAKTVNAAGGLNGSQIEIISKDDTGNPGTATTNIQALLSAKVVAIADFSVVDLAWADAVKTAGIPVVGVQSANGPFGTNPFFYPEGQTNDSATEATVRTAKAAGAKNIADFYCAESPVCAQSVGVFKKLGQSLGVPLKYNAKVAATAPNYTAQCVAAKQAKVDAVFIGDASAIIARIATDCARQGFNPIWVVQGLGFGMIEAKTPALKDNLWIPFPSTPFWATDNAAVKEGSDAIDKYAPGISKVDALYNQSDFMAWTSGKLLEAAVKASGVSGAPTSADILKGLNSMKGETLNGLTVPLTFNEGEGHKVDCWFTARVQGGTPKIVNNGQTTCSGGTSG